MNHHRTIHIALNGTDSNPFRRLGVRHNPFPQLAEAEFAAGCLAIQKLGGDPIPNTDYIREVLRGFRADFVDGVCARFVPGAYVSFHVTFPV